MKTETVEGFSPSHQYYLQLHRQLTARRTANDYSSLSITANLSTIITTKVSAYSAKPVGGVYVRCEASRCFSQAFLVLYGCVSTGEQQLTPVDGVFFFC